MDVAQEKKSFGKFLFLFLILLVLGSLYFFKGNIQDLISSRFSNKDKITQPLDDNDNPSVFSELLEQDKSNQKVLLYTPIIREGLDLTNSFDLGLKLYGDDWESILEDGQSIVEVINGNNGTKQYKLLYSKNTSLKYDIGDIVNLSPTLSSYESLNIIEGDVTTFAFKESDFESFENDILQIGNKLAFICSVEDCSDGVLNWALVIK